MSAPRRPTLLLPVACYLAVTIGVPLLNGAAAETGFVEHCLWVAGICGAIAVWTVAGILRRRRRVKEALGIG